MIDKPLRAATCGAGILVMLSGCSDIEYSAFGKDRVNTAGAHQLMDADTFEKIDLANTLDPEDKRKTYPNVRGDDLERAFYAFYYGYDPKDLAERRDRIQDRLIAASNQRCSAYKNYLRRIESNTGFWLGSLTTVLGGVGAIVNGEEAARTFSGLAGISSGVSAEFTKNFFESVASHIITPGIDARRQEILEAIDGQRHPKPPEAESAGSQSAKAPAGKTQAVVAEPLEAIPGEAKSAGAKPAEAKPAEATAAKPGEAKPGEGIAYNTEATIEQYTVERAVADAALYHGACSLNEGLAKAGELVQKARTPPDLKTLGKTIDDFISIRQKMLDALKSNEKLQ